MVKSERLAFIKSSLPNLKINDVQSNNNGWDNDIIIINMKIVFRFPKNKEVTEKVMREAILLESLRKLQPKIEIPEYCLLFSENRSLECVYYPYIVGVPLSKVDKMPNKDENAKLLGEFLTKLHSLGTLPELATNHTYKFWERLYNSVKKEVFPFLNESQRGEITGTFSGFLASYSVDLFAKTVIHGDLSASNIILDRDSERICGIIDFTDAQISDPAYDFAGFYWNFGPDFTKEVLSHYCGAGSSEKLFNKVKSFYGVQPIFHELLHAVRNGQQVDWNNALAKFSILKNCTI